MWFGGDLVEADVILWGTGFKASEFLMPMRVRGEGGRDLHETWDGDAAAYMGVTVPGFPNMFMVYGPRRGPCSSRSCTRASRPDEPPSPGGRTGRR
jgi:cation diffusion facilitator CzcD-associated flavoprotein CzcO